jgi:hypothetical protein
MRTAVLLTTLAGLLALSLWFAADSWFSLGEGPMPGYIYLAAGGGILFSLLIGCGLMALVFYSNRHGYDDETGHIHGREKP